MATTTLAANHVAALETTDNGLFTEKQATKYLDLKPGTLGVWRCTKRHDLPYIKIGRNVRYRVSDLDDWLNRRVSIARP